MSEVELVFPSDSAYLSLLRNVVEWFAARCDFSSRDCGRVILSVVEATTNIMRHAYGGDPNQRITLRLRCTEDGLELEFLDDGSCTLPGSLESAHRELLESGGRGIHMMQSCMDSLHYEVRPEGGARLLLRKRRSPPGGPSEDVRDPGNGGRS